jgi:hypothetical protein
MNIVQGCIDCDIVTGKRAPIGGIIYKDDDWTIIHLPYHDSQAIKTRYT